MRPLHPLLAVGVLLPLGVAVVIVLAAVIHSRVYGRILRRLLPASLEDLSPADRT